MQVERRGEGEKTMMERAESATASALMRATSSRLHVWSTNVLDKSTPANSHITPNNCHQLNTTRTQLYTRNSLFLVGTPVLFFVFFVFVFVFSNSSVVCYVSPKLVAVNLCLWRVKSAVQSNALCVLYESVPPSRRKIIWLPIQQSTKEREGLCCASGTKWIEAYISYIYLSVVAYQL